MNTGVAWWDDLAAKLQQSQTGQEVLVAIGPLVMSNLDLLREWGKDGARAVLAALNRGDMVAARRAASDAATPEQLEAMIEADTEWLKAYKVKVDARVKFLQDVMVKIGSVLVGSMLLPLL